MNENHMLPKNWKTHAKLIETPIRRYENVYTYKACWNEYVIKTILSDEEECLKFLSPLDFILQPLEIYREKASLYAVFPQYEKSLLEEKNPNFFRKAIIQLAYLHEFNSKHKPQGMNTWFDYQSQVLSFYTFFNSMNFYFPQSLWDLLISEMISEETIGMIHGDFLPFNILIQHENIFFIDFANWRCDFYERDIGRFLSDRNTFKKTMWYGEWRYYPISLYEELIDIYCTTRKDLNSHYNIQDGRKRILLWEIWNHLDVVKASLLHGTSDTPWCMMNKKAIFRLLHS